VRDGLDALQIDRILEGFTGTGPARQRPQARPREASR
jgi:hypothetical protein